MPPFLLAPCILKPFHFAKEPCHFTFKRTWVFLILSRCIIEERKHSHGFLVNWNSTAYLTSPSSIYTIFLVWTCFTNSSLYAAGPIAIIPPPIPRLRPYIFTFDTPRRTDQESKQNFCVVSPSLPSTPWPLPTMFRVSRVVFSTALPMLVNVFQSIPICTHVHLVKSKLIWK